MGTQVLINEIWYQVSRHHGALRTRMDLAGERDLGMALQW
jgi:hypothetical protein